MPITRGERPAVTYLLAASDAPDKVKAIADYVCDGAADDVEIQAAVDACSGGETLEFSSGTFNISSTITCTVSLNFMGRGDGTIWYLIDNADCNVFSGLFNAFCSIQINGNRTNQGATSHLLNVTGGSDVYVNDCLFWYANGDALRIVDPANDMWTWRVDNTTFENLTGRGIDIVQTSGARYIQGIFISNCYLWLCRTGAIYLSGNSGNVRQVMVNNCRLGYSNDCLIEADDCGRVIIDGNVLDSPGATAANNDACVYLNDCNECVINSNALFNSLSLVNGYGIDLQGTTDYIEIVGNIIYDSNAAWVGPANLSAANTNGIIRENIGYITPGELRSASGALTAGNANDIAFAWNNPEEQDVLIKKVVIEVTTAGGTAGSQLDVGIADDATGTNRGTEFFDDLDLNTAQINDSWVGGDGGTQTKWVLCEDNVAAADDWIVGQILTQNAASLVGEYYIEYVGR